MASRRDFSSFETQFTRTFAARLERPGGFLFAAHFAVEVGRVGLS